MACENKTPLQKVNSKAVIRDARLKLRMVIGILEKIIDKLKALIKIIENIELALSYLGDSPPVDIGEPHEGEPHDNKPLDSGDDPVAYNADIRLHSDGSIDVRIDNGKEWLKLGRRLAGVFLFIASGDIDCRGGDDLVGWRSRTEIIDFLETTANKKFLPRYVNNLLNLIRGKLDNAKYDRKLVQTHSEMGVRLAFKGSARKLLKSSLDQWMQANQIGQKKLSSAA
jgi:hypothetical protein